MSAQDLTLSSQTRHVTVDPIWVLVKLSFGISRIILEELVVKLVRVEPFIGSKKLKCKTPDSILYANGKDS